MKTLTLVNYNENNNHNTPSAHGYKEYAMNIKPLQWWGWRLPPWLRTKKTIMTKNQVWNLSEWMCFIFLTLLFFFLGLKEKIYILRLWIEVEDGQNHVRKRSQDLGGVWRMNKP